MAPGLSSPRSTLRRLRLAGNSRIPASLHLQKVTPPKMTCGQRATCARGYARSFHSRIRVSWWASWAPAVSLTPLSPDILEDDVDREGSVQACRGGAVSASPDLRLAPSAAEPQAPVVRAESLTKRFGGLSRSTTSRSRSSPGRHRLSRPERRGQDDDASDAAWPCGTRRAAARFVFGQPYAELDSRPAGSAPCSKRPTSIPAAPAATICRMLARRGRPPPLARRRGAAARRARGAASGASRATRSACGNGSGSRRRFSAIPSCSSSTSRPTGSTRKASAGCATSCAPSRPGSGRSSSRAMCSPRSRRPSTRC